MDWPKGVNFGAFLVQFLKMSDPPPFWAKIQNLSNIESFSLTGHERFRAADRPTDGIDSIPGCRILINHYFDHDTYFNINHDLCLSGEQDEGVA